MSATAPARPIRRSCTPGSTPRPAPWSRELVARGYELLADYASCRRHPRRAHRRRAGRLDRRGARRPARPAGARPSATATTTAGSSTPTRSTPTCPTSARARSAASTVPGESIICTWTTTLALATDAVARGATLLRGHAGPIGGPARRSHRAADRRRGDSAARWVVNAAGLGRRPDRPAVRATTGSPSPRAAASCSSSTSWPGRWSTGSCCRCRRPWARACWSAPPSTAT